MNDSTTDNVVSGVSVRAHRRSGKTSHIENATQDMTHLYFQTTARKRGDLITVSQPLPLADAGLQEFTDERVNGGILAVFLLPNSRLVKVTLPVAAVKATHLMRPALLPAADKLIEYLTGLNDGRMTYTQWSVTEPGGVEMLIHGYYAGQRDVEIVIDNKVVPFTLDMSGWFLFTGEVVGPVKVARRGKLLEAQKLLDAIAKTARTGKPFNLDRYVEARQA